MSCPPLLPHPAPAAPPHPASAGSSWQRRRHRPAAPAQARRGRPLPTCGSCQCCGGRFQPSLPGQGTWACHCSQKACGIELAHCASAKLWRGGPSPLASATVGHRQNAAASPGRQLRPGQVGVEESVRPVALNIQELEKSDFLGGRIGHHAIRSMESPNSLLAVWGWFSDKPPLLVPLLYKMRAPCSHHPTPPAAIAAADPHPITEGVAGLQGSEVRHHHYSFLGTINHVGSGRADAWRLLLHRHSECTPGHGRVHVGPGAGGPGAARCCRGRLPTLPHRRPLQALAVLPGVYAGELFAWHPLFMTLGFLGFMTEGILTAVRFRPNEGMARVVAISNHGLIQAGSAGCVGIGFYAIFRSKARCWVLGVAGMGWAGQPALRQPPIPGSECRRGSASSAQQHTPHLPSAGPCSLVVCAASQHRASALAPAGAETQAALHQPARQVRADRHHAHRPFHPAGRGQLPAAGDHHQVP